MGVVVRQEFLFCLVFWCASCRRIDGLAAVRAFPDGQEATRARPGT